jgi:hypothetical protein
MYLPSELLKSKLPSDSDTFHENCMKMIKKFGSATFLEAFQEVTEMAQEMVFPMFAVLAELTKTGNICVYKTLTLHRKDV